MAIADLTPEQQGQHRAVLKVALQNLAVVTDSLQTLDHALYDEALDNLDGAKVSIEHKLDILKKLQEG